MNKIIKSLGLALALLTQYAYAVPTLFFDGDITYTSFGSEGSSLGQLTITSVLTATQEIDPAPELMNSSLTFTAFLTSVDTSSSFTTAGLFEGGAGNDISIVDGNFNDLLLGEFSRLEMVGRNGRDSGRVGGIINATDGILADMFGEGRMIALVFNINTLFGEDMFESSFSGNIDGRIEGAEQPVSSPGILALLGLGIVLMGAIRKIRVSTPTYI